MNPLTQKEVEISQVDILRIASDELGLTNLDTINRDYHDFVDVSRESIRKALEAAYELGHRKGYNEAQSEEA